MAIRPTSASKKPKRELQRVDPLRTLTPEEATRLKAWAVGTVATTIDSLQMRNAVIVLVLLGTAARRFEVCAFRCGNFHRSFDEPRAHFDEAKGNIEAEIPISDETWSVVERWRAFKAARGEDTGEDAPLFCNRSGGYLCPAQLHNIWKTSLAAAGVPTHYGVHASRHTAGMLFLQATQSLPALSEFLRHSSVKVTDGFYKHVLPSAIREGLKKAGL